MLIHNGLIKVTYMYYDYDGDYDDDNDDNDYNHDYDDDDDDDYDDGFGDVNDDVGILAQHHHLDHHHHHHENKEEVDDYNDECHDFHNDTCPFNIMHHQNDFHDIDEIQNSDEND